MLATVFVGTRLDLSQDAQSIQHLLDALDFDQSMILHFGGMNNDWSIHYGSVITTFASEGALPLGFEQLQALASRPETLAQIASAQERWNEDEELMALKTQLGLDESHRPRLTLMIDHAH